MLLDELVASGAHHEDGRLRRVADVLEEVEEGVFSPVDVVDDQHRRPFFGQNLEQPPGGPERLLKREDLGRESDRRGQSVCDLVILGSDQRVEVLARAVFLGSCGVVPVACRTAEPSAQKVMPSPYGRHARAGPGPGR